MMGRGACGRVRGGTWDASHGMGETWTRTTTRTTTTIRARARIKTAPTAALLSIG